MPPFKDGHHPSIRPFVRHIRPSYPSVRPSVLSVRPSVHHIRPPIRHIRPSVRPVMMPPPLSAGPMESPAAVFLPHAEPRGSSQIASSTQTVPHCSSAPGWH